MASTSDIDDETIVYHGVHRPQPAAAELRLSSHIDDSEDVTDDWTFSTKMDDYHVENNFTIATAEKAVSILGKHFESVGDITLKRNQHGTTFSHCEDGVELCRGYTRLRQMMQKHARLQLMKDCITRIHQFEMFLVHVKKLVQKETTSWFAINHSKGAEMDQHQTNLTVLSSLCDDFRMHLNHWICIKQRIQNSRWLRPILPSIVGEILQIKNTFMRIQETALWWTDKLLRTGMQVFAYVDRRSLTHNDVFSIVRGIEEFNTLIQVVKWQTQEMKSSDFMNSEIDVLSPKYRLIQCPKVGAIDSGTTKSVPFVRLLHSLAMEWAKAAVAITYSFIDTHPDLHRTMYTLRTDKAEENERPGSVLSTSTTMPTSDYHSETHMPRKPTEGIDLMTHAPPLLDFGKKEKEYVGKVIQITSQRTTLLRRKTVQGEKNKVSSQGDVAINEDCEMPFTRNDQKRKSVSWGDSHDQYVRKQYITRYEDALWKAFGTKLADSLRYEISWSKPGEIRSSIGSLDSLTIPSVMCLVYSIRSAAVKGYFSNGAIQPILTALGLVTSRTAGRSWDISLAGSLSSMSSDKCVAVPLMQGVQSTKTAMLLRNTLTIINNVLQAFVNPEPSIGDRHKGIPIQQKYLEYQIRTDSISKLLATSVLCEQWCSSKANSFLRHYNVPAFVLIIYGDLKSLLAEIEDSLRLIGDTDHCKYNEIKFTMERMSQLYSTMCSKFSSKTAKYSEEIIINSMPKARFWKNKGDGEIPANHLPYAEDLVTSLMEPICEGAKNLTDENQIKAIEGTVNSLCSTWTKHFTKNKMRLSLHGTRQLECDFAFLKEFIDIYVVDEDVKKQLFNLPSILRLSGIILLLKRQPDKARTASRNQIMPIVHDNHASNHSVGKDVIRMVNDREEWLALRRQKPGQNTFFSCLSRNENSV